jgi:hypothetical protein
MAKKIVISKAGYDATSETNPNRLVFSSDYNTLKYYSSGYVDVNYDEDTGGSGTFYTATVAHGLSYIPFFYAYVDVDSSGTFVPCPDLTAFMSIIQSFYAFADSTNIKFVCQMKGTSGDEKTARFRYFIFKNKINT